MDDKTLRRLKEEIVELEAQRDKAKLKIFFNSRRMQQIVESNWPSHMPCPWWYSIRLFVGAVYWCRISSHTGEHVSVHPKFLAHHSFHPQSWKNYIHVVQGCPAEHFTPLPRAIAWQHCLFILLRIVATNSSSSLLPISNPPKVPQQ
jgi:hypothetical protein